MRHGFHPRLFRAALAGALLAPGGASGQSCGAPSPQLACPGAAHWNTAFGAGGVRNGALPGIVRAAIVFRGDLVIAGTFTSVAGVPASNIARFSPDAMAWSPLGEGVAWSVPFNPVEIDALEVFDADGPEGPAQPLLYIGGFFDRAGGVAGVPCTAIARWDGAAYSAPGACTFPEWDYAHGAFVAVHALRAFNSGADNLLYAAGTFTRSPCGGNSPHVTRWRPAHDLWESTPGVGLDSQTSADEALALEVFDEGEGPRVFVAGQFTGANCTDAGCAATVNNIARLSPTSGLWEPVGPTGANGANAGLNARALVLRAMPDPDSPLGRSLFVGGAFTGTKASLLTPKIAKWNGSAWVSLNTTFTAVDRTVASITRFEGALHVGMQGSGFVPLARRNSAGAWAGLGLFSSFPVVDRIIPFADAGGARSLWILGNFDCVDGAIAGGLARLSWCCPGDADGSRSVDFTDLSLVLSQYASRGEFLDADVTGDHAVGFPDLNLVLTTFGSACP